MSKIFIEQGSKEFDKKIIGYCDPLTLVPRILICKDNSEFRQVISAKWDPLDNSNPEKKKFMFVIYHEIAHLWDYLSTSGF